MRPNPVSEFVKEAKAGKLDGLTDPDYNLLVKEAEDLSEHWLMEPEAPIFALFKVFLEDIHISHDQLDAIAEQLCDCYEKTKGAFSGELEHPEYLDEIPPEARMVEACRAEPREMPRICPRQQTPETQPTDTGSILQSPRQIYDFITQHVYGQKEACKAAAMLLYNHTHNRRRNVLFLGPSGCGKTEIWRICKQLYPYIIIVDANQITAEGWAGSFKIPDIFSGISPADVDKTIVVFDEFDKLCEPKVGAGGTNHSHTEQDYLLKFIEGHRLSFPADRGKPALSFDSSKISFAFLGSFETLTKAKCQKENHTPIGFGGTINQTDDYDMYNNKITVDDLVQYSGMRREIAGRIGQIVQLQPMTETDYVQIMHDSTVSPLRRLEKQYNIVLHMDETSIQKLAKEAASNKMGVRYLNSRTQTILDDQLFADCNMQEYELNL